MEMKRCTPCGEDKPIEDFPIDRGRATGRHPYCKPCKAQFMREANARWKERNPEAARRSEKRAHLKKKYGITLEAYEELLAEQEGRCAICQDTPDPMALAVDHCHDSLEVRGLLCRSCNQGLGHFRDDPHLLESAAAYLRR